MLALLLLAGCSKGGSSFTAPSANHDFGENNPSLYVAFGNSITLGITGRGQTAAEPYPALLQTRVKSVDRGAVVVNQGIGGENTSEGLARFRSVLDAYGPGFILIMEGTNSAEDPSTVSHLRRMVQLAKANKTVPLVATIPPQWDEKADRLPSIWARNRGIASMAATEGVELVDAFTALNTREFFGSDGVHPNDAGHVVLADTWFAAILHVR